MILEVFFNHNDSVILLRLNPTPEAPAALDSHLPMNRRVVKRQEDLGD